MISYLIRGDFPFQHYNAQAFHPRNSRPVSSDQPGSIGDPRSLDHLAGSESLFLVLLLAESFVITRPNEAHVTSSSHRHHHPVVAERFEVEVTPEKPSPRCAVGN